MKKISKKVAEKLADLSATRGLYGEVALISPEGCKLYRRKNNHYYISGYAPDGADVSRALSRVC